MIEYQRPTQTFEKEPSEAKHKGKIESVDWQKVSEQLGSNDGGWYEDAETRERHYVKWYENPDQAKVEYIANAVYGALGINAPRSQLVEMNGRIGVASGEIAGAKNIHPKELMRHSDTPLGFIADAYLANWDVVGLDYDNMVAGEDGRIYRIDNGGTLHFRAQGEQKEFPADHVPELETMRNPLFQAGKVFANLKLDELRGQAERLCQQLTSKDIDQIVKASALDAETADAVRAALIGRRRYIAEYFGIPLREEQEKRRSEQRIPAALERISEIEKAAGSLEGMRVAVSFLADTDMIENQEVQVIDATDDGVFEVTCKLTERHYDKLLSIVQNRIGNVMMERMVYGGMYGEGNRYYFANALMFSYGGMAIELAADSGYRTALGLCRIHIPYEEGIDVVSVGETVNDLFSELLSIKGGLEPPSQKAESAYKKARYTWHHKIDAVPEGVEKTLERREVMPGYHTIVDPGKWREYWAESPFAVIHNLHHNNALAKIVKSGGLLSTHERFRRGALIHGMSSDDDMKGGGGDNVFTRIITEQGLSKRNDPDFKLADLGNAIVVFDPALLDRTDFFIYNDDKYGTTDPDAFAFRMSPSEFFEYQKQYGYVSGSEQMFRTGIPTSAIRAVVCREKHIREEILAALREEDIETINGFAIEDFVRVGTYAKELIALSSDQEPETKEEE